MNIDEDLTAAPATPLVLTILSEGETYGYVIIKRMRELSAGEPEWTDAMVYPLFHRLRRLGYLRAEWRTLPEGSRRKYYAITDDGRAALTDRQRGWLTARGALGVWRGTPWLLTALGAGKDRLESLTAGRHVLGVLAMSRATIATPA